MFTIAQLEKELGISQARLRNYLKGIDPDISLGRSVGYRKEKVLNAIADTHADILRLFKLDVPTAE